MTFLALPFSSVLLGDRFRGIGKSEAYVDPDGQTWKTFLSRFPFTGRIFDRMAIPFLSFKVRNSAILANTQLYTDFCGYDIKDRGLHDINIELLVWQKFQLVLCKSSREYYAYFALFLSNRNTRNSLVRKIVKCLLILKELYEPTNARHE